MDAPASWIPEVRCACELAREAGALVVRIRAGGTLDVERKAGDEPVTVADRAASELIVGELRRRFPGDVVVSEEEPADDARLTAERVWYVDPIDGTKDFIRGEDGFAVMIGLCVGARPVLGVVYQPMRDRIYYAAPGVGAWVDDAGEPPRRIKVSEVADAASIRLVSSRSHRGPINEQVRETLGVTDELAVGSVGLKLGLIALGERDLYVNPWPKCKAWDTCAPEAILVAAGGKLTDTHGAGIRYDVPELGLTRGLVASNGRVHAQALARLAHLFPATSG